MHTSSAAGEKDRLDVNVYVDGELHELTGEGNGPIAAFVDAINARRAAAAARSTCASSTTPSTP